MIPVTQTKVVIRDKDDNVIVNGNCWAAAIASLLEIPLTEVPNFEVWFKWKDGFWSDLTERFLIQKGFTLEYDPRFKVFHPELLEEDIKSGDFYSDVEDIKNELKDKYYLVSGISRRGVSHVTIWQNGLMVHDPYPTREGILKLENFEAIRELTEVELSTAKHHMNNRMVAFPSIREK